ncbi:transporter substrate-binding domain-containing protein [Streptosporangium canum]|uniref:transporter substrate-binding domain-containing protein n=1 Tax=Streptosporangium canum TaxID=324952 RepID=UPI0036B96EE7
MLSGGEFLGFEVDVARYIAGRLGVPREGIGFKALSTAGREQALVEGTVNLVVASYSITDDRKERVGFAGPYHIGHKHLMVRAHDTRIRMVEDLSGKRMCKTRSAAQLIDRYGLRATLVGMVWTQRNASQRWRRAMSTH